MANPKFCFPNWTLPTANVVPTASGAGWIDLDKLQGDVLSEMARYPGVNVAGSRLVIDLGQLRNVALLALPHHNAGIYDSARIRFCTDAALTDAVIDTGWKEFFGVIYPYGTLDPSRVEWIDGRLTAEDAVGVVYPWMHEEPVAQIGRYLDIQLDFRHNPAGYIDLGQVVASPLLTSVQGISYGVTVPFYVDPSTKTRAKGGPQFADKQRKYLMARVQFNWLGTAELYSGFFELVRRYGLTQPFFFIYDSDADPVQRQKQCFMCTADEITAPSNTMLDNNTLGLTLTQAF
jgi:hypothetical protein